MAIPKKKTLRRMADQLWSIAVRNDWNNKCAVCGKYPVEAHHLIPRQNQQTRYSLENGIALCSHHHQWNKELSPHQNAAGWIGWMRLHHPALHASYMANPAPRFKGTVSALYYCDIILSLWGYVEEEDFVRICGKSFSQHLLNQTKD